MPRLWSWLRRVCTVSRPAVAPPRSPRPLPPARARFGLDAILALEDRIAPSATPLPYDVWRNFRFHVDDVTVSTPSRAADTVTAAASNGSFGSLIGLDQVLQETSYRGTGYTVAVLDTGVDYNHPDLGGGWGRRIVGGYDFVNNDADPMDDNGHGTHVAGIIGSSSATYSGVAPNVNIVALKVLGADGNGSFGAIEDALRWVIANQKLFNIVSINMSLGSGNFAANPYDFLEDEFASLKQEGVFISVAAGNSFYAYESTTGLAFPGISPSVVSVGAVWTGDFGPKAWGSGARDESTAPDRIASFSQRAAGLTIMAPGAMITSTYLGARYQMMAGTSMASPVVAGAAALLHQALDAAGKGATATQDGILALMKSTGVRVVDGDDENDNVANTGLAFQRLNLAAAMRAVKSGVTPVSNVAPALAAVANQTVVAGGTITVALSATDANGDPLSYHSLVAGGGSDGGAAYQLKSTLGLYALTSTFTNAFGLNEKWLGGANGAFYVLLPNGELRRWAGAANATLTATNLVATLDSSYYADPSKLLNATPSSTPAVTVRTVGSQLVITTSASAIGTYRIIVSASDNRLIGQRQFSLVVQPSTVPTTPPPSNPGPTNPPPTNLAPTWTPIADQQIKARDRSLVVPLNASDADGNALTFTARVVGAAGVTASIANRQLSLAIPVGVTGNFTVEVVASDGSLTATTSFRVTIVNNAPILSTPGTISAPYGATQISVPFTTSDADGDVVTVTASAKVTAGSANDGAAFQLRSKLDLVYSGSYFTNAYGLGEKWLKSSDGLSFYCILPNGELHKFTGSVAELTQASTLIAKLDVSYYADPSRLWNAAPPSGVKATVAIIGGNAVVTLDQPYRGAVTIELIATDGAVSVKKTIVVTFA